MSAIIAKLDTSKHKYLLMSLLLDISKNQILKESLVFKGGTALYFLFGLERFSTDLDFDLIGTYDKVLIGKEIIDIMQKYGTLRNHYIKRNTIFAILSYGEIDHNIKVEISTRGVSGAYENKNFMGIKLLVLQGDYLTANKFIALLSRDQLANRDIFDIWFILKHHLPINKAHIEAITNKSFHTYILEMIHFLEHLGTNHKILDGLGTTLDESKKHLGKHTGFQRLSFSYTVWCNGEDLKIFLTTFKK